MRQGQHSRTGAHFSPQRILSYRLLDLGFLKLRHPVKLFNDAARVFIAAPSPKLTKKTHKSVNGAPSFITWPRMEASALISLNVCINAPESV